MSVQSFIPQLWASAFTDKLRKTYVYGQLGIINRNYEGIIRQAGDTVHINQYGDLTVSNYTRGAQLTNPEQPSTSSTALVIDQEKKIYGLVDDVDKAQASGSLMDSMVESASNGFADTADQYIAGLMADNVATANLIGTEASPKTDLGTSGKAYTYLVQLGTKLDEANVPQTGRWAILPPFYHEQLLLDSTFLQGTGSMQSEERMRNGYVGQLAGFSLFKSNNVPYTTTTTKFKVIAGVGSAVTYADQIVNLEAFRPHDYIGDILRGLHVYGAKVVHPNRLAMLIVNRP